MEGIFWGTLAILFLMFVVVPGAEMFSLSELMEWIWEHVADGFIAVLPFVLCGVVCIVYWILAVKFSLFVLDEIGTVIGIICGIGLLILTVKVAPLALSFWKWVF